VKTTDNERPGRALRAVVAAGALALLAQRPTALAPPLAVPGPRPGGEPTVDDVRRLDRGPAASAADAVSQGAGGLADLLASTGGDVVARLFRALVEGSIAPTDASGAALSPTDRRAVVEALGGVGRAAVEAHLAEVAVGHAPADVKLAALEVLGALGDERSVDLVLDVATPAPPPGSTASSPANAPVDPRVARGLHRSLAELLQREPRSWTTLERRAFLVDRPLLREIALAAGVAARPRGIDFVAGLLGWYRELDLELFAQLRRIAIQVPAGSGSDASRSRIRAYLLDVEPLLRAEAADLLGHLEDADALPDLIALLADREVDVRDRALLALSRVTAMTLPPDADRWHAWYEEELAWRNTELPRCLARLGSTDTGEVVEAIGTLSRRRLFRAELADGLARALSHSNGEVRRLTCIALGQIGSTAPVDALTLALDDDDETVRAAARDALERITGRAPVSADQDEERPGRAGAGASDGGDRTSSLDG